VIGGPANGTFTINTTTGAITYTPNPNYSGGDSFTYTVRDASGLISNTATVTVTVTPLNDAPVSTNDSYATNEDTPLTIAAAGVLSNDTDADGNTLTAVLVTTTTNGTLTLNADGSFTYTPTLGFNGADSFTYRANDGTTNSAVSTVTITVTPVNNPPVANNDNVTTNEDVAVTINVVSNDTDADDALNPSSVTIVANPANGTVSVNATTGEITYTPSGNYNGNDSFTYTVRDASGAISNTATVAITITPVNDAPVAVADNASTTESVAVTINILANDSDVDDGLDATSVTIVGSTSNGTLSVNPTTGVVTYTPNAGYIGNDSFTYTVEDLAGVVSNTVTVSITVAPVNDPPVAVDDGQIDYYSLLPLTIDVIGNDSDPDNALSELTIISITQPSSGTVAIVNGELVYTPDATTSGLITFTYTIQDPGGLTATGTVTLFVEIIPLKISQGFSPNNGDADNNTWYIESIESYPNNSIKVYDRWGLLVYQAKNYNNVSVVWNGSANTGQQSGKELDQGTYYYIVDLGNNTKALSGYVVIAK
jgi:gliding motility-associated-like protein